MTTTIRNVILAAGLASGVVHAMTPTASAAAVCGLAAADAITTGIAVRRGGAGVVETNPLLAGPNGRPRWGLTLSLDAVSCAAHLAVARRVERTGTERAKRRAVWLAVPVLAIRAWAVGTTLRTICRH